MTTRFVTGLLALGMLCGLATQATALDGVYMMKLEKGNSCLEHEYSENVLMGDVRADQFVYIQFEEAWDDGSPSYYRDSSIAFVFPGFMPGKSSPAQMLPGGEWYVTRVPVSTMYAFERYNFAGLRPDNLIARACFLDRPVTAEYLDSLFPSKRAKARPRVQVD